MFNKKGKYTAAFLAILMTAAMTVSGCSSTAGTGQADSSSVSTVTEQSAEDRTDAESSTDQMSGDSGTEGSSADQSSEDSAAASSKDSSGTAGQSSEEEQEAEDQSVDLTDAVVYTLQDAEDIHITEAGVYVLRGTASEVTVYIEAEDTDKVQLVLDGVSITNADTPCIYALTADKVTVITSADTSLTVTDSFAEDEENADAAIFSCEDLVLKGTAVLTIQSSASGVDTKDELKITGGTYVITAEKKGLKANDRIRIKDGTFTITADEGIEATYVQIQGGTFTIEASDDGINASQKSDKYAVTIEISGGELEINMAQGDTDALDSNGDLIISGGTLNITAQSAFDYDGTGTYTGGTLIVNGEETTELTQSMMGDPGQMGGSGEMGGMNEGMNGRPGGLGENAGGQIPEKKS